MDNPHCHFLLRWFRVGSKREFVVRMLLACTFLGVAAMQSATAAPRDATLPAVPGAPPTSSQDEAENTGEDFARPQSLFQLFYEYKTAPGSGSTKGAINDVTSDIVNLRMDRRIDLASQWALSLRGDLPFLAKNPITSDNPAGHFLQGVGDADVQAALVHELGGGWTAGFGARLTAPTGGDNLSSGKWQIMPGAAVRYALSDMSASYIEPLVRYNVSFAGDPSRKNISNLQLAPTVNLSLPDHWFVTFYPSADIRINYGDPVTGQTGRLFFRSTSGSGAR